MASGSAQQWGARASCKGGMLPPAGDLRSSSNVLPYRCRCSLTHKVRLRSPGDIREVVGVVAATVVCVVAVVAVAAAAPADDRFERTLLEGLIVGLPVGAGVYATRSPSTHRFGLALLAAGLLWSLTALGESSDSLLYSIGRVSGWLVFPVVIYLMLAYPDGRLAAGVDRRLLGAGTMIVALLFVGSAPFVEAYPQHSPWASCTSDCPPNAFFVLSREPAVMSDVVAPLGETLGILLFAAVAARQIARWRGARPVRRRALAPVMVMAIVSAASLAAYFIVRRAAPDAEAVKIVATIWSLTIPGIAAAFLLGLVRRRVMVGEVLSTLSVALSQPLDRRQLQTTLATALTDDAVDVLVPDDDANWRDTEGRPTEPARFAEAGRAVTAVGDKDGTVAALVHDPELARDPELLSAVRALVLATVRHDQVTSKLATSLHELDVSRQRIARAADLERSRIERDLHDGAQQRLIGLRIKLSLAEEIAARDPVAGARAVHELGGDVDQALEELRSLAHGVYPSLLSDRGILDALRSVAAESPLPVHFGARGVTRQPPEVETAVYFACLEAVQNAIKHARGATALWVTLRQDQALGFEVRDDGAGFTPLDGDGNGGLRNMRDRMEAVGGRLTVESAPGDGTRVRGVVPLR
jgi:signal transduction histidine kinase